MRDWNDVTGDKLGGSTVSPVNEHTIERQQELEAILLNGGSLKTTDLTEPYVFTFDLPSGRRTEKITCSFLDSSGERQASTSDLEDLERRYIEAADGILLLLDPVTMEGAKTYLEPGQHEELRYLADNRRVVNALVQHMLEHAEMERPEPEPTKRGFFSRFSKPEDKGEERLDVPIAVVLTKIDAVERGIGDLANYLGPPNHAGYYDTTDAAEVDRLVRGLIAEWDGKYIENKLEGTFNNIQYFAASSLGHPTEDGRVSQRGWHPKRVADPLVWLLSRFDLVEAHAGPGSS
jgi:hypothetical protein